LSSSQTSTTRPRVARAPLGREPVGQQQHHAGEEPRFADSEQEAQHVELRRRLHEGDAGGDRAPQDQDARDPLARADARQQHVRRDLEQEVADEGDAGAEAVDDVGELQRLLHLQLGEADVDTINDRDDVDQEEQRQVAQRDAPEQRQYAAVDGYRAGCPRLSPG
jgi:hypothetical protein